MTTLVQQTFPGFYEALLDSSIATLKQYEPEDAPYWGCFSGGKDSCVIKHLAGLAGVNVEWHYSVTTIDPPELVQFIKRQHPDVVRDRPQRSFYRALQTRGLPTRKARWCCEAYKESKAPKERRIILGVRAAESPRRAANWQTLTFHRRTKKYAVLPILHWRDDDVWRFIREHNLPYCKLYDEGFKRIGCVGCPMAGARARARDFARWPAMAQQWYRGGKIFWERRKAEGTDTRSYREFATFEDFWNWWKSDKPISGANSDCQGQLEFWA